MTQSYLEVMAPAGNFECLEAALKGGADSVYFGVEQLNMRARAANNFKLDDLEEIVSRCSEKGVKTYLTMNTILYDHDMRIMKRVLDRAAEAGVSAVIIADQAGIFYAREKGLEVHLSTQLNISNLETIKFYSGFADVMVLARELSVRQMKAITEGIDNENIIGPSGDKVAIEVFAHGALCMAVSGKCYLSLHEQNASANRGACYQNCRKGYVVTEKESNRELEIDNEYIMSPKDLCTIDFLDKLVDAGVSVFKLEGRARSPEYVYTVTKCYREALNAVQEGTYTQEKAKTWMKQLDEVYNRGFWDGYYLGRKLGEWSKNYGSRATKRKVYLSKVHNYFQKAKVAEFKLEALQLKVGDEFLITGPNTGVVQGVVTELRVEDKVVDVAKKGDIVTMPISEKVRRSDKLYMVEKTQFAKNEESVTVS